MATPALHKAWARQLICAVGGVEAAGAVTGTCAATASRWQTGALVMNAAHIAALQSAGQTTLYSDALSALVNPLSTNGSDPMPHAAHAAREAAALPALVIAAQSDGRICERERRTLLDTIAAARAELDAAERALCADSAGVAA